MSCIYLGFHYSVLNFIFTLWQSDFETHRDNNFCQSTTQAVIVQCYETILCIDTNSYYFIKMDFVARNCLLLLFWHFHKIANN